MILVPICLYTETNIGFHVLSELILDSHVHWQVDYLVRVVQLCQEQLPVLLHIVS